MPFNSERHSAGVKNCEVLFPLHEIDSFNGTELKKHILAVTDEIDAVIIDFSKVVYLNSSGLRELIQIMKITIEKSKSLYLTRLSDDIMKIFVHTNLDRLFTFSDTLQGALDALNVKSE